jgi:hypothetical protein
MEPQLSPRLYTISEYGTASDAGRVVFSSVLVSWAIALCATFGLADRSGGRWLFLVAAAGLAVAAAFSTQAVMGEVPAGVERSLGGRLHDFGAGAAQLAFLALLAVGALLLRPGWLGWASLLGLVAVLVLGSGLVDVSVIGHGTRQRALFAGAWLWQLAIVLTADRSCRSPDASRGPPPRHCEVRRSLPEYETALPMDESLVPNPKRCSRCKQLKDRGQFYKSAQLKDGLYSWCKECSREVSSAIRLDRLYGLTPERYAELLVNQEGCCAICGTRPAHTLEVDHHHQSGTVRALLCGPCNRLLGLAKEDPGILRRAAEYLEHYSGD